MSMNKWGRSAFFGLIGALLLGYVVSSNRYDTYEKSCPVSAAGIGLDRQCRSAVQKRSNQDGALAFFVSLPLLTLLVASNIKD